MFVSGLNLIAILIESTRQAFALADAAYAAYIASPRGRTATGVIGAMDEAGLDGSGVAAMYTVISDFDALFGASLSGSSLKEAALRIAERLVVSNEHAGKYTGNDDQLRLADEIYANYTAMFKTDFHPDEPVVDIFTREADQRTIAGYDNEMPTGPIQSRFKLDEVHPIAGRGVILEDIGIDDPAPAIVPRERAPASFYKSASKLMDIEHVTPQDADFRFSM